MSKKTSVGIIGAGEIGTAVATIAAKAGFPVTISNSRGPETLVEKARALGETVVAGTVADAAKADLVLVAVPFHAIAGLPTDQIRDRIVIDANNYGAQRDGEIEGLSNGELAHSEHVAKALPGARVVKTLGNLNAAQIVQLARPAGSPERGALPVASDDLEAAEAVRGFLNDIGWDSIFTGSLAESRSFEPGKPAFVFPYVNDPDTLRAWLATLPTDVEHQPKDAGRQVSAAELAGLIESGRTSS